MAPANAEHSWRDAIGRAFREEAGRSTTTLIRLFGDIDLAEESVQEAFVIATMKWPADGLPPQPGAWITVTARNRAIDRLRCEATRADRQVQSVVIHERPPTTQIGARSCSCMTNCWSYIRLR